MHFIKNKKKFLKVFISVSIIFLVIFSFFFIYNKNIQDSMQILSAKSFYIRNTGCIIKTFGRNTESVSALVSFYNPRGELIRSYERSWQGWELDLECIVLESGSNILVFPHRIFTDATKYGTGILLFDYYSQNSFPAIYDYQLFSPAERFAVYKLFKMAKFSPYLFKLFSGAKAKTINLREFKPDQEYVLFVNSKKNIYLKKN